VKRLVRTLQFERCPSSKGTQGVEGPRGKRYPSARAQWWHRGCRGVEVDFHSPRWPMGREQKRRLLLPDSPGAQRGRGAPAWYYAVMGAQLSRKGGLGKRHSGERPSTHSGAWRDRRPPNKPRRPRYVTSRAAARNSSRRSVRSLGARASKLRARAPPPRSRSGRKWRSRRHRRGSRAEGAAEGVDGRVHRYRQGQAGPRAVERPRYDDGERDGGDVEKRYAEDAARRGGPGRHHDSGRCHTTAQAPAGSPKEYRGLRPAPTGRLSARSTAREGR
jgi:hypothetical protein